MAQRLSIADKSAICCLYEAGNEQKEIAKKFNTTQPTVSRTISNFRKRKDFHRKIGSGRRKSLSEEDKSFLKRQVSKSPRIGSRKLTNVLREKRQVCVTDRTMRRSLCSMGLFGRVACSKPLLSQINISKRFEHAQDWINKKKDHWDNIIFSDETKINLFGSDGRVYVRRREGTRFDLKHLAPTVKFGGGCVMVWGCFTSNGVGKLCFIEGTMNSEKYTKILDNCLNSSADMLGLPNFTFQQDNDPKHSSKLAREYFADKKINVMSWPSQSPDMNPIEHLWDHLKRKIKARLPKNYTELKRIAQEEWHGISPDFCRNLVESMPDRAYALWLAKGGHTSY